MNSKYHLKIECRLQITMVKLPENPQIIHIVADVIALCGIAFYFKKQNDNLKTQINVIENKLKGQMKETAKHRTAITNLSSQINSVFIQPKHPKEHVDMSIHTDTDPKSEIDDLDSLLENELQELTTDDEI